ncbi:MAG: HD-GYP domain-containing protein [Deltaproteobacteria bacterium]|nr:HD-GYP domain-containing protein [Deltaproteobacteria bacterium]
MSGAALRGVSALMLMLRYRDPETYGHSMRVAALSRKLVKRAKLSPEQQECAWLAGMLHDIGKIAVPEKILFKPSPLDESEWRVMRTHAEKGAKLVSFFPFLRTVAEAVASHHEFFDGKGYPRGLSGLNIPIAARIVAVADAYDAMVLPRLYSSPLTRADAMGELLRCAGTQFDPLVVEWLVQCVSAAKKDEKERNSAGKSALDRDGAAKPA